MVRKALTMNVYPEYIDEYIKRHNELWPEMKDVLLAHGCKSYSIYVDRKTNILFAYLEIEDEARWAEVADTEINRKWWDYMADIMETNPDNSPVSIDLENVFHLD